MNIPASPMKNQADAGIPIDTDLFAGGQQRHQILFLDLGQHLQAGCFFMLRFLHARLPNGETREFGPAGKAMAPTIA